MSAVEIRGTGVRSEKTRRAAALAGVLAWLEEEGVNRGVAVGTATPTGPTGGLGASAAEAGGPAGPGPWALHGRQEIMRMRSLLQQRVLGRRTR
jgi:hypothetical protein